jgi:eukaryotic-like serine/threonine-protein kinase
MTDEVTIEQAGATLAGDADDALDGASLETLPKGGDAIGRYIVLEHLGTGGMGVVFAAYDPELDRKLAVKLLRMAEGGSSSSEGGGARLLDEARALARLSHPNVIAVHDVGVHKGRIFVAMEYIDGQTLAAWQRASTRAPAQLCRAYVAAGEGLAAAHRAGLVHRDFKPDNVMIDAEGRIRVLDFGLARAARRGLTQSEIGDLRVDDPRTRGLAGTPAYMAPEQFADQAVDARTDQFSFCVCLWEAVFGERPFRGDTVAALAWSTLHDEPTIPPGSSVDARIERALLRGLSKDPAGRFSSMDALVRELQAGEPSRRAWVRAGAAALLGGAIAAVAVAAWPERTDACAAQADVSDVWGAERRQALLDALGEAAESRASTTLQAGLDSYASALSSRLRRACEAPSAAEHAKPDDLARTDRCLQRRRSALEHAVTLLVAEPQRARTHGSEIVGALPAVVDCDTLDADDSEAELDPERIELVDALESRLDDAEMRIMGGQHEQPREILKEALARAHEHSLHGVEARAHFLSALLYGTTGENENARRAAIEALSGALRAGRNGLALWAATVLVQHHAFSSVDLQQANDWLQIARALHDRTSPTVAQRIAMARADGVVAFARGEYAAALEAYEQAVALCRTVPEQNTICVRELTDVSQTLSKLGRHGDAIARLEEAIAEQVETYGKAHPQTAVLLTNYAATLSSLGRSEEALEQSRHALELAEGFWGADNPEIIPFLGNASDALTEVGRLDEAAALLDRVVAILESQDPLDRQMMSYARHSRGMIAQARGQWSAAADDFEQSAALREAIFGPTHPLVHEPRFRRADALLTGGDPQAALAELDRIVEDCPEAGCTASDLVTRAARVEALAALHRVDHAEQALDELLAARDRSTIDDPRTIARVRAAELCLEAPTPDTPAHRRAVLAALREHDGPGSPPAARVEARQRAALPRSE